MYSLYTGLVDGIYTQNTPRIGHKAYGNTKAYNNLTARIFFGMKKIFAMFSILLCCLCCAACSSGYSSIEEAEADGARLGECITIDGVNVSGMSPAEALETVETAHTEALKALYYTVSAGEDSLDISGSLLPVAFNTREVLSLIHI